jgi:divalent metal cation (Fe/Co/Zn/Cd) transporter
MVQLSPRAVFLALEVQFKPDLRASELTGVIDTLEKDIHQNHKSVKQIYIEIDHLKNLSDGDQSI